MVKSNNPVKCPDHYLKVYSYRGEGGWAAERDYLEEALRLYRVAGDRLGQAQTVHRLSDVWEIAGDYAQSWAWAEQSLGLARETGWRLIEQAALGQFGEICCLLGDCGRAQPYLEQALTISREIGARNEEYYRLWWLSTLSRYAGDYAATREWGEQALRLARDLGASRFEAAAHHRLGDACLGTGELGLARAHHEQALSLYRQCCPNRAEILWIQAGAAQAALAQGDLPQAQAHVAGVLSFIDAGGVFDAGMEPFRTYLTCYQVLRAGDDPRAPAVLDAAYRLLQEHAARTPNEALRRSLLENVAENREILREWEAAQARE